MSTAPYQGAIEPHEFDAPCDLSRGTRYIQLRQGIALAVPGSWDINYNLASWRLP